uniref:Reverse transcriptase domain-containing protein n=1 Tax=Aegilops tauschii subsp. strangulata TaxID=200361 RepID=A0A453CMX8_AEGTS
AKAFDNVSWEYLLELLQALGFSARWRDWITMLLASSTSSFLLNGAEGKKILHYRGLRQGDPLSPLLFIIAIDPLHRLLQRAMELGQLDSLPGRDLS